MQLECGVRKPRSSVVREERLPFHYEHIPVMELVACIVGGVLLGRLSHYWIGVTIRGMSPLTCHPELNAPSVPMNPDVTPYRLTTAIVVFLYRSWIAACSKAEASSRMVCKVVAGTFLQSSAPKAFSMGKRRYIVKLLTRPPVAAPNTRVTERWTGDRRAYHCSSFTRSKQMGSISNRPFAHAETTLSTPVAGTGSPGHTRLNTSEIGLWIHFSRSYRARPIDDIERRSAIS